MTNDAVIKVQAAGKGVGSAHTGSQVQKGENPFPKAKLDTRRVENFGIFRRLRPRH
jgi:hypothetical protein